jgi:acyl carrier protein
MRERVRTYIENLPTYQKNPFSLKDDDSLIKLGLIDSMAVLELVAFLEESFKIEIEPDDLTRDNFESILAIHRLLESKSNGQQSS